MPRNRRPPSSRDSLSGFCTGDLVYHNGWPCRLLQPTRDGKKFHLEYFADGGNRTIVGPSSFVAIHRNDFFTPLGNPDARPALAEAKAILAERRAEWGSVAGRRRVDRRIFRCPMMLERQQSNGRNQGLHIIVEEQPSFLNTLWTRLRNYIVNGLGLNDLFRN